MKSIAFITLLFIFCSCSLSTTKDKNLARTIPPLYTVDSASLPDSAASARKITLPATSTCIFDTSTYKFTTTILREYDSTISFLWDDTTKEAIIKVDKSDTIRLHVGGCNHFVYSVVYTTKGSLFDKDALLVDKTKWLAKTFFREGFDTKYVDCITKKQYDIDKSEAGIKYLTLTNKDSAIDKKVYEPVNFEIDGNRTKISLHAYKNTP